MRFKPGEIIRLHAKWGVIVSGELPPLIEWWDDGSWRTRRWFDIDMIIVPHESIIIPDEVIAKATEVMLTA